VKQHKESIQTSAERVLARALHRKKILCQENYYIHGFEVDLWFPGYKLAVEVDGYTHLSEEQRKRDHFKDQFLVDKGILLIRFANQQIRENPAQCVQRIELIMAEINALKNNSSINCDWKETLKTINIPKTITTKPPINSIEDYFLSMDKKPP
jgi:very-short-patch-repair endonuclease